MYDDPHFSLETEAKWAGFVAELKKQKRAVLTADTTSDGGHSFTRTGYIALWSIDRVDTCNGHLRFRFVDKIANLT